ncbi:hypothetical protein [Rickettsia tamurae]|nr:hypothetical protein [Rickettsia tamurae]
MTQVKLIHATMLCEERSDTAIQKNNKKCYKSAFFTGLLRQ